MPRHAKKRQTRKKSRAMPTQPSTSWAQQKAAWQSGRTWRGKKVSPSTQRVRVTGRGLGRRGIVTNKWNLR